MCEKGINVTVLCGQRFYTRSLLSTPAAVYVFNRLGLLPHQCQVLIGLCSVLMLQVNQRFELVTCTTLPDCFQLPLQHYTHLLQTVE